MLLQKLDMAVLKKELGIASYGVRAKIVDEIKAIMQPSHTKTSKDIYSAYTIS